MIAIVTGVVGKRPCPLLLNHHFELAEGVSLVSKMLSQRRDSKQGTISRGLNGLSVWHEFQESEPAVASIAATKILNVEHHLVDIFSCGILVASMSIIYLMIVAASRLFPVVGSRMASMSANCQTDVLAREEQLLPNLFAIVALLNLVTLLISKVSCPASK